MIGKQVKRMFILQHITSIALQFIARFRRSFQRFFRRDFSFSRTTQLPLRRALGISPIYIKDGKTWKNRYEVKVS